MFRDCIREIVKTAGIEVLDDPTRFKAFVGDLASEYPKERDFIISSDNKYLLYFADAKNDKDKLENAAIQASKYLVKQKHIDPEWAEYISSEIKVGLCIIHVDDKEETDTDDKIEEDKSVHHETEDADKQDEKPQHSDNSIVENKKREESKKADNPKVNKGFLVTGLIIIVVIIIAIIGTSVNSNKKGAKNKAESNTNSAESNTNSAETEEDDGFIGSDRACDIVEVAIARETGKDPGTFFAVDFTELYSDEFSDEYTPVGKDGSGTPVYIIYTAVDDVTGIYCIVDAYNGTILESKQEAITED